MEGLGLLVLGHSTLSLPFSWAKYVTIASGKYKSKTVESFPVDSLKWIATPVHGNCWLKVAKLLNCVPRHLERVQFVDGHHQKCLATSSTNCFLQHFYEVIGQLDPETDVATYASLLQLCTREMALSEGELVHERLTRHGHADNTFLNNLLVQMYGRCGSLQDACAVFENMMHRNAYTWTIMLTCCAQNGQGREALQLFDQMQAIGLEPNMITFICILDACAGVPALEDGQEVHASIIGNGCEANIVVGTALVNMYGKCGSLDDARVVFKEMRDQDVISWSAMIGACAQNGHGKEALQLFGKMQVEGFKPDKVTYMCVLDACASMAAIEEGREIHASLVCTGWDSVIGLQNALVNMYGKCWNLDDARAVFMDSPQSDVISWNAMIAVCAQNGHGKEALQLFGEMQAKGFESDKITCICILDACTILVALEVGRNMHAKLVSNGWESDVVVGNALINMYGKCGSLEDARTVFVEMTYRDLVSWNAIITVCAQNGHGKEALQIFGQMHATCFRPNRITFISLLDACASMAALEEGRETHANIVDIGLDSDVVMGNVLINMYGKCGIVDDARAVFADLPRRNVISWNAMITVCAQNGHGKEALQLFDLMQAESVEPNEITFVFVLSACSHMGLVADAGRYFTSMSQDYGISPSEDHYVRMVDLLGRVGQLDKAEKLINSMPFEPNASIWLSLLSSCRLHSDVERAVRVANRVFDVDEKAATPYVLLANIHAEAGRWAEVEKVQNTMTDKGESAKL